MNRRKFLELTAMGAAAAGTGRRIWASPPHAQSADGGDGRVSSTRAQLTLDRVLHGKAPEFTQDFLLADLKPVAVRRFTEYSGDLSGRYIGAMATVARINGWDPKGAQALQLDRLVNSALALQKPEGYFGAGFDAGKPGDNDMALLWGNGRLLVGLLEYYSWKPRPEVLIAAGRLGDFLVRIGPMMLSAEMREAFGAQHFASSYVCWMQQTEGLALLYRATKDERYRKLAEQTAAVIERRPSDHVHGYLTSLRGVMDLYAETGDVNLLKQCTTAWGAITASKDALITGGVPEGWSPNNHRTEGCAECDWVRLNLALWHATGEHKYAALAERAMFNELAFNQYETGDFGHRVYTETGFPAAGAVRAWWCCTLHGLRTFPAMAQSAFRAQQDRILLDFPMDGFLQEPEFAASVESRMEKEGVVRVRILRAPERALTFSIRKPEWADEVNAMLPGQASLEQVVPGYLSAERVWRAGEQFDVSYKMKLRSEESAGRASYWYGPWLLGAPASVNPAYFNELTTQNRLLAAAAGPPPTSPSTFSVPVASAAFRFVPAEFPDQPQIVQLRALAEQTGQPTTSWELRLLTKS
ncbi:MAG: glycoside hydrolase family 127 protein [Acidobacteriota bacterium]|nr:glycoside hydrolase family 127 protein [Acidobacteriota bacterium]